MKKLINSILFLAAVAFTLTGCEDVPSPFDYPDEPSTVDSVVVVTPTGSGTEADPYNVAALLKLYDGTLPETDVYVVGVVSSIDEISTSYGNGTYYISDDGTTTNQYEIYRGYGLDGAKFKSEDEIKVGDTLVVKGTPILYNTTKEFTQGSSIVSINGGKGSSVTPGTATGEGTQTSPYSVAKALEIINAGTYTADKVYVSGVISEISELSTSYGNATYFISDDGTSTSTIEVFRGYGLDGAKFESENDLKVGDKVVVYGEMTMYNTTPEITTGSSIYSLNGTTAGGGTGTTDPSTGGNGTVSIDGTTVTLSASGEVGENVTLDLSSLGYANQDDVSTVSFSDGATAVFSSNGETNGPKYYDATKGVRVYKNNQIVFTGKSNIASIVMTCDAYNGTDYVGNTTATFTCSGKTGTYTNVYTGTTGGGIQLRVKTITINYAK